MRIERTFSKKFIITFVCMMFAAIISLCSANIISSRALNSSNYEESATTGSVDDEISEGDLDFEIDTEIGVDEEVTAQASGDWSDYTKEMESSGNNYYINNEEQLARLITDCNTININAYGSSVYIYLMPNDGNVNSSLAGTYIYDMSAHYWSNFALGNSDHNNWIYIQPYDTTELAYIIGVTFSSNSADNALFQTLTRVRMSRIVFQGDSYTSFVRNAGSCYFYRCVNISPSRTFPGGSSSVGGIVGYISGENTTTTFTQCINFCNITSTQGYTHIGGIVGKVEDTSSEGSLIITNCVNYGSIQSQDHAGGIVGRVKNGNIILRITYCINYGSITGTGGAIGIFHSSMGGIIGEIADIESGSYMRYCIAVGSFTNEGTYYIGGLIGTYDSTNLSVSNCVYRYSSGGAYGNRSSDSYNSSTNITSTSLTATTAVKNYMSSLGFSYNTSATSTWMTGTVYNLGYSNFSSSMVIPSFFVKTVTIGMMHQTVSGTFSTSAVSSGYRMNYATNNGSTTYNTSGTLTTLYYTKCADEIQIVSYTARSNYTQSYYDFLGIFSATSYSESLSTSLITDSTSYPTYMSSNDSLTLVAYIERISRTYYFSTAYINNFSDSISNSTLVSRTSSDYSYDEIKAYVTYGSYTTETNRYFTVSLSSAGGSSYTFTVEYDTGSNYELYGIYKKSSSGTLTISQINQNDLVENYSSVFEYDNNTNTLTFTPGVLAYPFTENEIVFVFVRYRYEVEVELTFELKESNESTTSIYNGSGSVYYGYESRTYRRKSTGNNNKAKYGSIIINIAVPSNINKTIFNPYSWYSVVINNNNSSTWYHWGGTEGFVSPSSSSSGDFDSYGISISKNTSSSGASSSGTSSGTVTIGNDIISLLGAELSSDGQITIELTEYVVTVDTDYLENSGTDNSVGGRFETYTYYFIDTYDSSVTNDNYYVFGENGGVTTIKDLEKTELIGQNTYFNYSFESLKLYIILDNNKITLYENLDCIGNDDVYYEVSGYKLVFRVFMFYDLMDNNGEFDWDETSVSTKTNTGQSVTLGSLLSITKTSMYGYYTHGDITNSFAVSYDSSFDPKISIDEINTLYNNTYSTTTIGNETSYTELSLVAIANKSCTTGISASSISKTKTIYLYSFYSLTTIQMNISSETTHYSLTINGENSGGYGNNNTYTFKSYSKISLEITSTGRYSFSSGANTSIEKYINISIDDETISGFTETTFQLINENANESSVELSINYENILSSANYSFSDAPNKVGGVYIIDDFNDLLWMAYQTIFEGNNFANTRFKQVCDITIPSRSGFASIGTYNTPFKGYYDGQGYSIYGLNIDASNFDYVGLFGYVEDATIKNLNLVKGSVSGYAYVGAVVGYAKNSVITGVNNYSCDVEYVEETTLNHIYIINNSTISSLKGSNESNESENLGDLEESQESAIASDNDSETTTTKYYEKFLLRVKEEGGFNNYTFVVDDYNNETSIGDYEVAYTTTYYSYYVGGFAGYLAGKSDISVSSSRGDIIKPESSDLNEGNVSLLEDLSESEGAANGSEGTPNYYIAGFVGYVDDDVSIEYCYTSQSTFGGNKKSSDDNHYHTDVNNISDKCCTCSGKFVW